MAASSDEVIFELAAAEDRVVLSEDADFGTLLAFRAAAKPSVVLFRRLPDRRAAAILDIFVANLPSVQGDLEGGAMVVIEPERVRVRALPIGRLRD